jgi:low temperature requirement protein LtrA
MWGARRSGVQRVAKWTARLAIPLHHGLVTAHVPAEAAPARVSTLELFFDLVFVYTMTQVTEIIVDHPDAAGLAQAAIVLFVIFWMYGGYAWLTNASKPDTAGRRIVLLAAMAAFFLASVSVPNAFGANGIAFGLAYLAVNVVHAWLPCGRSCGCSAAT